MFSNSKNSAVIVSNVEAPSLPGFKSKNGGFFTFRENGKRVWGRVGSPKVFQFLLTKAQVSRLPENLPRGTFLSTRKCGAVTRTVLNGPENVVKSLLS